PDRRTPARSISDNQYGTCRGELQILMLSPHRAMLSRLKISRHALACAALVLALTGGSTGSSGAENLAAEAAELTKQGMQLERAGKYAEAEEAYRKGLSAYEKTFGPTNPWVGAVLNAIGRLYIKQHRDTEAEPVLLRGLAIMESRFGPDSIELVAPLT